MAGSAGRGTPDDKLCPRCGRCFAWRARWRRSWDRVKYCGERCRRSRLTRTDRALEASILARLGSRPDGTICPSEAARDVDADDWRGLMERTRAAARHLAARDLVEVRQRGRRVDPRDARGPIRLARHPARRPEELARSAQGLDG